MYEVYGSFILQPSYRRYLKMNINELFSFARDRSLSFKIEYCGQKNLWYGKIWDNRLIYGRILNSIIGEVHKKEASSLEFLTKGLMEKVTEHRKTHRRRIL